MDTIVLIVPVHVIWLGRLTSFGNVIVKLS